MVAGSRNVPAIRFLNFSAPWKRNALSDFVISLDAGVSVNSIDRPAIQSECGVLKTSSVSGGIFVPAENKAVTEPNEIGRLREAVQGETIIISRMNTPALVGENAFVDTNHDQLYLPDRLWAAKPQIGKSLRFLSYITGNGKTRAALSDLGTGTSGSMKNITKNDVLELSFLAPEDPEEQKKIAAFLGAVDEKVAQLERKKALLTDYKTGCMQQLFSRQIRFKTDTGHDFPDWERGSVGDFCEAISGLAVPGEEILETHTSVRLVRGVNITEGKLRHNPEIDRYFGGDPSGLERFLVNAGDIVIGMDGSKVGRNAARIGDGESGNLLIQRVARLRSNSDNVLDYAFHHIFSFLFHRYVDRINTSSGIPHISLKQILDFPIPLPHPDEQRKISDFLSAIDDKIALVGSQITQARAFKTGLLQQMFV